jgi:hypothetical protein
VFQTRGSTLPRLGDKLVGDQLCPSLQSVAAGLPGAAHEHPVVLPQVSHFMQVPLRTSVKLPHSPQASPS